MVSDLLKALDGSQISLLSLSTAFDIIDHSILLFILHHTFGISSTALSWFQSCPLIVLRSSLSTMCLLLLQPWILVSPQCSLSCTLTMFLKLDLTASLTTAHCTSLYLTASLTTANCTSLVTFLNFLRLFIELNSRAFLIRNQQKWFWSPQRCFSVPTLFLSPTSWKGVTSNLLTHSITLVCQLSQFSLSNCKSPLFVIYAILNLARLVQYATISLRISPRN